MLSNPMALAIIARECVEKFGDLRKAEAVVGTGPWMLERYDQNVGSKLVRNPAYFLPDLPHIEHVNLIVDEDNGSRMSAFLAGRYDLGWEFPGIINRVDWVQIKDNVMKRRPVQTAEFPENVMSRIYMRTDKAPFSDVRVRRAMSLAVNRQRIIDAVFEGVGVFKAIEENVMADGKIDAAEARWLKDMLFADGKIDANEKKFLIRIKKAAKQTSPQFDALYDQCMKTK